MTEEQQVPALRFPEFTEEWESNTIEELLTDIAYGINTAATEFDGENKYIRITDIDDESRRFSPKPLTSPKGSFEDKYFLKQGDIVFARTGASVGKSYIYDEGDGRLVFAGFLIKISFKKRIARLVFQLTLTDQFRKWVEVMSVRSGQPGLNAEEYKSYVVNLPTSKKEQKKIATFLAAVDERLRILEAQREELLDYKQGVMQRIFDRKLRFRDDNGEEFPEWKQKRFDDFVSRRKDKYNPTSDGGGSFPSLELESIESDTGTILTIFRTDDQKSLKSYFKSGDVLFGKLRPYLRKYVRPDFDGVCSTEIWVLYGSKDCENEFLYYLIQTPKFNYEANVTSGSKMPRSDWKHLSDILFDLPCVDEQKQIVNYLSAIDNKISILREGVKELRLWKQGLLQNLFI